MADSANTDLRQISLGRARRGIIDYQNWLLYLLNLAGRYNDNPTADEQDRERVEKAGRAAWGPVLPDREGRYAENIAGWESRIIERNDGSTFERRHMHTSMTWNMT